MHAYDALMLWTVVGFSLYWIAVLQKCTYCNTSMYIQSSSRDLVKELWLSSSKPAFDSSWHPPIMCWWGR